MNEKVSKMQSRLELTHRNDKTKPPGAPSVGQNHISGVPMTAFSASFSAPVILYATLN